MVNDNREFNLKKVVRLCMIVNTLLMLFVSCMMIFFVYNKITPMVIYSAVAIVGYISYYILIKRKQVCMYMWCVYATIVMYMAIATVCLGYNYGFHLYCMSIIPIIFYSKYMSLKLNTPNPHPMIVSGIIIIVNIISSGIAIINGPLYVIDKTIAAIVLLCNYLSVSAFLIYYTKIILDL